MTIENQSEDSTLPNPPPQPAVPGSGLSKDSLNMGMLCHLLALCGIVIPFGNIIGPLIMWMLKKDNDPYVDAQGKESVNFQISMTIYMIISFLLIFVVIGAILLPLVGLANIILTIIGTIKASKGEPWNYPLTIRLIK